MGLFRSMRRPLSGFVASLTPFPQRDERDVEDVRQIMHLLGKVLHQQEKIMHTLEETLAAVQAARSSDASIIALLVGIKKQLDSALGGALTPSQQMRVDAIFNEATAAKSEIDDAVKANTDTSATGSGGNLVQTQTVITSSGNPANAGDTITLSAGLSTDPGAPAGGPAATGIMTFFDGDTALGTGTIDSTGVAAISSSTFAGGNLAVGDHSLHATYGGDAVYASSESRVLTQTIAAAPSA